MKKPHLLANIFNVIVNTAAKVVFDNKIKILSPIAEKTEGYIKSMIFISSKETLQYEKSKV